MLPTPARRVWLSRAALMGRRRPRKSAANSGFADGERLGAGGWKRRHCDGDREIRADRNGADRQSAAPTTRKVSRACVCGATGLSWRCHQQPPRHAEVDYPLRRGRGRIAGVQAAFLHALMGSCARWTKFEDNVLPGTVDCQYGAPCKSPRLDRLRCFEWLRETAEPGLDNTVAGRALVNAAGDRLHLWEFRHRFIVEDCDWRTVLKRVSSLDVAQVRSLPPLRAIVQHPISPGR